MNPTPFRRDTEQNLATKSPAMKRLVDFALATLEHLGGNRKATAAALAIGETTLWRKLKSYGRR